MSDVVLVYLFDFLTVITCFTYVLKQIRVAFTYVLEQNTTFVSCNNKYKENGQR